jgi:UDP-glucose 4-epimerase
MKIKGAKIFLTGGMGFIGSNIAQLLVKKGAKVVIYDNFSTGYWENIADVRDKVKVIKGDILDYKKLEKSMRGCDAVVHEAAQLEIARCMEDPVEDLTINTIGTLNVLRACVVTKVKKLVWASSAGIYGQLAQRPQMEDTHPQSPNWQYGVGKLAVEKYANIFFEMYKLPIYSLRYSIVYGPNHWYGGALSIFLKKMLEGKDIPIFGDGKQTRDLIYVGDVAELNLKALECEIKDHVIVNGSSNIEVSVKQLAETVIKSVGRKDSKFFFDPTKEGEVSKNIGRMRLPSELKAMLMSNKKAEKLLGWKPKMKLADGIKMEFGWLKKHPNRWSKIKI